MSVAFPTRPGRCYMGEPIPANACHCEELAVHATPDETCCRCGRFSAFTIRATWRHQARLLGRGKLPAELANIAA